jgi:hypothetical protein
VIELLREFFSDTMNFVHRQILQISALHILLQEVLLEVLFSYGAVEKPVGGGYIPSRLFKVLVPDKEEYAILADVLREARARNNRDSSMDDEDLQSRTSEETYRAQRTRTMIGMTRKHSYTKHQRVTKLAPQAMQAALKRSRWKAWLSGQSGAKTTSIRSLLTSQSRPRLTDENIFQQPLTSSLKKIRLATHHTAACPLQ